MSVRTTQIEQFYELRKSIVSLASDISALKSEISELRSEITALKSKIFNLEKNPPIYKNVISLVKLLRELNERNKCD